MLSSPTIAESQLNSAYYVNNQNNNKSCDERRRWDYYNGQ